MELRKLIKDNLKNSSITQFCKDIKISRRTFYNIIQDKNEPSLDTIKKICKYFDVDFINYIQI